MPKRLGRMSGAGGIGRRRTDRTVVLALLGLLAALCWAYLLFRVGTHGRRSAPARAGRDRRALPRCADLVLLYALWVVVIAAMMLPAAAPSVLLYARVKRLRRERWVYPGTACCSCSATCSSGAAARWSAALAGWLLHDAGALDESMAISYPTVGALALVAAGVYQWTPAKHACLDNCRTPLAFVLTQLAARRLGRVPHGRHRRPLLHRLLLAAAGAGCCRPGVLEPARDRRPDRPDPGRKTAARRPPAGLRDRARTGRLGHCLLFP